MQQDKELPEAWEALPEADRYTEEAAGNYYTALCRLEHEKDAQSAVRLAKAALFRALYERQISASVSEALLKDLSGSLPLRSPDAPAAEFLEQAVSYLHELQKKPVTGKLYLLVIGKTLETIGTDEEKRFAGQIEWLRELSHGNVANLTGLTDTTLRGYFSWIIPMVGHLCNRPEEAERVYSLFGFSPDGERRFLTECLSVYCTRAKAEKDNHPLCMYLGFALRHSDAECCREMGEQLREQLGKSLLHTLDQAVKTVYHNDQGVMRGWECVWAAAGFGATVRGKLSSLFGFSRH